MRCNCVFISVIMIFVFCAGHLFAQTIEADMTTNHVTCPQMLMDAMNILPKLYKEKSFDSLSKAVEIWENACRDMPELKITKLLLAIEESNFRPQQVDASVLEVLSKYAASFPSGKKHNKRTLDETQRSFYKFSIAWSSILLNDKRLDVNEKFVCKVLNGEIEYPQEEIRLHPEAYREMTLIQDKDYAFNRRGTRGNLAVDAGFWIPTKELSVLGAHPSLGLHLGVRPERHQIDLSLELRFLNSPNFYTVVKDGITYTTTYYLGGYIGVDYTFYLLSTKKLDIGLLTGTGLDGFDFAETNNNNPDNNNATLFSFNANAGLRLNYYFEPRFHAGLVGRYSGVHYSSHGGTNLTGDAFSIGLVFGYQTRTLR